MENISERKVVQKWCICQMHEAGFPSPPYYTSLPEYGPWDSAQEAQWVADQLTRLDPQPHRLAVRPF
jgi:hypothetical protein